MELNEFNEKLDLFEMANVQPNETGLEMSIYVSERPEGAKHGPRIKVSKKYGKTSDLFSISFNKNGKIEVVHSDIGEIKPKDVKKAKEFISLNLDVLLDLWYDRISQYEAIGRFKKV